MKQPVFFMILVVCLLAVPWVWAGSEATSKQSTPPADLGKLRDITGVERVPEPPPEAPWPIWPWLTAGALVVGALLVWLWRRHRRREAPPPPADQWALAEIQRIAGLGLAGNGEVERYHTLLSDVVRRYLELRFQLPASRQTTPEFLQTMAASGVLAPAPQALLGGFLERCDLAKFARAGFSPDECNQAAAMARAFIEETAARVAAASGPRVQPKRTCRPEGRDETGSGFPV